MGAKARTLAYLGRRDDFNHAIGQALDLYEKLPSPSPTRFGKRTEKLAAYAITSYPASSCLALGMFEEAKRHAETALREYSTATARDRSPSREAITKLELAMAMAKLGDPEHAVHLGKEALSSSRIVRSVVNRARQLEHFLLDRYPELPAIDELRDRVKAERVGKEMT